MAYILNNNVKLHIYVELCDGAILETSTDRGR